MGGLAQAMNIHQSTASNLVRALVERGLVSVTRHRMDRRAVMLRLLPPGGRILRRSPGPFAGVLPEALAALDQKTLKRLEADLKTLIGALHADARAAKIPLAEL
jgi:DNA-binding MarR family transcriptional regulator